MAEEANEKPRPIFYIKRRVVKQTPKSRPDWDNRFFIDSMANLTPAHPYYKQYFDKPVKQTLDTRFKELREEAYMKLHKIRRGPKVNQTPYLESASKLAETWGSPIPMTTLPRKLFSDTMTANEKETSEPLPSTTPSVKRFFNKRQGSK